MEFNPPKKGLKFTAVEANSSIRFNTGAVTGDYVASTNDSRWFDYTIGDTIYLPNVDDIVVFRAKTNNASFCPSATTANSGVTMTGKIAASGNIQYLLDKTGKRLDAPNNCYYFMFANCTSLIEAPELPAKIIGHGSYGYMFLSCSLINAPELSSTNLNMACYRQMFSNCFSMTNTPNLPATILYSNCYRYMFENCRSLTKAPDLVAITLSDGCYHGMFSGCSEFTNCHMKVSMTNVYDKTVHGDTAKTVIFDIP